VESSKFQRLLEKVLEKFGRRFEKEVLSKL